MFSNISQQSVLKSAAFQPTSAEPENPLNPSRSIYDFELQNQFTSCRKNLILFLRSITIKNELKVNFKVIKKYYKVPFDDFPETVEITQILERIIQRYFLNKMFYFEMLYLEFLLTNLNRKIGIKKTSCY